MWWVRGNEPAGAGAQYELADDNQYTVKRYKSEKRVTEDGFVQTRIRLESLNPAFPSWDLDTEEDKYQVIAEFVRVLE